MVQKKLHRTTLIQNNERLLALVCLSFGVGEINCLHGIIIFVQCVKELISIRQQAPLCVVTCVQHMNGKTCQLA